MGAISDEAVEGTLKVMPRGALLRDPARSAAFQIDPIILDAFTHLLGCWGLDRLESGDVIFPLRMGSLTLFGPDPAEGEDVSCRISIRNIDRHRVVVDAELVRDDGTTWMRIGDWVDWRFHWPSRYRDVFPKARTRMPGRADPCSWPRGNQNDCRGLASSAAGHESPRLARRARTDPVFAPRVATIPRDSEGARNARLIGRIAVKEAVRRLLFACGEGSIFPADFSIDEDSEPSRIDWHLSPRVTHTVSIAFASNDQAAIAMATVDDQARIGVGLRKIEPELDKRATAEFREDERRLFDNVSIDSARDAWAARFLSAKDAAVRAMGINPACVTFAGDDGVVVVTAHAARVEVETGIQGDTAYAWTQVTRKV